MQCSNYEIGSGVRQFSDQFYLLPVVLWMKLDDSVGVLDLYFPHLKNR